MYCFIIKTIFGCMLADSPLENTNRTYIGVVASDNCVNSFGNKSRKAVPSLYLATVPVIFHLIISLKKSLNNYNNMY